MTEGAQRRIRTDLMPLDEERLVIERLRHGDREAFATLYGWYGDAVYRQAILPRCPNRELAEDCLRDTFRTALEKIDTFRLEQQSIFFWLRRIAVNKAIDVHRRRQRDQKLVESVREQPVDPTIQPPPRPDRGVELQETKSQVEASLALLNPRYASALRLRLLEERSREECAHELGVEVGNFDVILHRACKAFRKVFPP